MEELADSADSKSAVRKGVGVRIPLPALCDVAGHRGRMSRSVARPGTSRFGAARLYARRMRLERALAEIGERLTKAQEELRIAEEQLVYQADVAEEAKTRALVAETPLADREHQEAKADHERMVRIRDAARREVADLKAEQDKILDRMLG